jgi:tRNA (mo5U34)-methyltransferase
MTLQSLGGAAPAEIAELAPWFHNLHLPGGVETAPDHPLGDFPAYKWAEVGPALPDDLSGWRALDIGCNAGFYTFELARRGADVLGVDVDEHYLRQARWARERIDAHGSVEFRRLGVYELARLEETFDLVVFMGVLYHLRHPLLALDLVASRARRLVVLQTLTMPGEDEPETPSDLAIGERDELLRPGWPKMAFVEHRLADDPTNWWAPDHACVVAMARSAGLEVVARPGHEIYVCRPRGLPTVVADELADAVGQAGNGSDGTSRPKNRQSGSQPSDTS